MKNVSTLVALCLLTAAVVGVQQRGAAQSPTSVRIQAVTGGDLRTWDTYVTQRERAGTLRRSRVDRDPSLPSRTIERLQQYHEGVRIFGAEVVRDADGGLPISIFGELSPDLQLSTTPAISADDARGAMLTLGGQGSRLLRAPELVIVRLDSGDHRLAYTGVIFGVGRVVRVFVDAGTGAELWRYSELQTQAAVGSGPGVLGDTKKVSVVEEAGAFYADDKLRPPVLRTFDMRGNLLRALDVLFEGTPLFPADRASDADNQWSDRVAVDAHAQIGWTYDYYFKRFGRRGLDGRDRPITSLINGVSPQLALLLPEDLFDFAVNAFWCGTCGPGETGAMYFGNGLPPQVPIDGQTYGSLAASLDVIAHELTHGVIDSSSALLPEGEAGALNEAIADIMGTSVEFFYQPPGTGLRQADYLIAEDSIRGVTTSRHGLRSLADPQAFGDPDHYSARYPGQDDNGGVHINNGIVNQAFYLAVEGGTNRTSGLPVQGVGAGNREQIERVYYRAFTLLLPASASFSTARAATIRAAQDLFGAGSRVEQAVTQAWTAVGVF